MSRWKYQLASVALLCALTGLPLASAVCGLLCRAAEVSAAGPGSVVMIHHQHHVSTDATEETSSVVHSPATAASSHDCRTDDGALPEGEPTITAVPRQVPVGLMACGITAWSLASRSSISATVFEDAKPRFSTTASSGSPLVLRV